MKHTQGPWVNKSGNVYGANGDNIAMVAFNGGPDSTADLRLITAAPELLDFVCGVYIDQLGHGPHADETILNKARELIFKITGEK
jgi:hypothetical protein